MENLIRYARSERGPVTADGGVDMTNSKLTCYECNGEMYRKRAHKRRRNGFDHNVIAHFAHKFDGHVCAGESVEHLAAKDALLWSPSNFYMPCRDCGARMQVHVSDKRVCELVWGRYRLDVGVLDHDGSIIGGIEVFQTHLISDEKADALTSAGLAWCEVRARDVLDGGDITCIRAAKSLCDSCCEKEAAAAQVALEASIDAQMLLADEKHKRETFCRAMDARIDTLGIPITPAERAILRGDNGATLIGCLSHQTLAALTAWKPELDSDDVIARAHAHWDDITRECASEILSFGKYKGDRFSLLSDLKYIRYLAMWTGYREGTYPAQWLHAYGEFKDRARARLNGVCLLCFERTGAEWKHWCASCYREAEV